MSMPTDEERRANRARLAQTLTAIAALWAVVAALTIVGAWGETRPAQAAAGWATISGAVRAVEVVAVEVRGRAPVLRPGVHVEYAYTVAGQTFTGSRVQPVERPISPESELGRALLALSPGDSIPVYVNPNDPTQAVLRRDVSWRGVVNGFVLLVLAAAVGVVARRIPAGPGRIG